MDDIAYVTVGGDAVAGSDEGEDVISKAAFNAYKMVCGRGDVSGDGVIPLEWTQLDGAQQVVLPGVVHSIAEPGGAQPRAEWHGALRGRGPSEAPAAAVTGPRGPGAEGPRKT